MKVINRKILSMKKIKRTEILLKIKREVLIKTKLTNETLKKCHNF